MAAGFFRRSRRPVSFAAATLSRRRKSNAKILINIMTFLKAIIFI